MSLCEHESSIVLQGIEISLGFPDEFPPDLQHILHPFCREISRTKGKKVELKCLLNNVCF